MFRLNHVLARQKMFEGFRGHPYRDTVGVWTIGYGCTVWNGTKVSESTSLVTEPMAHNHMKKDMFTAIADCQFLYPGFEDLSDVEQEVLIHMSFQLGRTKLRKFVKMNAAVERGDVQTWADEMTDSLWWMQTPRPAAALRTALLEDEWPPKWAVA